MRAPPTMGSSGRRERIRSGFGCAVLPKDQFQQYRKNRRKERSNRSTARQDREGNSACRMTGYVEWNDVKMLFGKGSAVRFLTRILEFRPLPPHLALLPDVRISPSP